MKYCPTCKRNWASGLICPYCDCNLVDCVEAPVRTGGDAQTLSELRSKVCVFGYKPTTSEVSLINDLLHELHCYREGGVTEEMLRRNDGYIKVGRGCVIALASEVV